MTPVEQIKSRISTVDVVGSYLKLTRAGTNFKAVCPFHSERTPSFFVSPARDVWHCFGCGKGGDQFQFVMDLEGVEFREALEILARRAGIEIKIENPKERNERDRLLKLMEDATAFYEFQLTKYPTVRNYLKERGVKPESIKNFRIGYALPEFSGWRTFSTYALKKGYSVEEIQKAGLALAKQSSGGLGYYDRFRGRIMFPIADGNGRIIGFGGRVFSDNVSPVSTEAEPAKYINTPQTILYDKSRVLYAIDKAKVSMRKENACIVVEGYMDAVMAHQAGTAHTVAVSGTALTYDQLQVLKRLSDTLLTSFDTDEAGQSATLRSVDLALKIGFDVRAIDIPRSKDPADLIKEDPNSWIQQVAAAEHILSYFLKKALSKWDSSEPEGKRNIASRVLPFVARLSQNVEKAHWVGKLAGHLKIPEEAVWEDLRKIRVWGPENISQNRNFEKSDDKRTRTQVLEERLLGILLAHKTAVPDSISRNIFSKEPYQILFSYVVENKLQDAPTDIQVLANKLIFEAEILTSKEEAPAEMVSCARELTREHLKQTLEKLTLDIRRAEEIHNSQQVAVLVQEFSEVSKKLSNF